MFKAVILGFLAGALFMMFLLHALIVHNALMAVAMLLMLGVNITFFVTHVLKK